MQNYCLLLLFLVTCAQAQPTSIVELKLGKVRGTVRQVDGRDLNYFEGIKYGEAARFEKPRPTAPWTGVYEANRTRDACHQFGIGSDSSKDFGYSEDCLYVNVWAPAPSNHTRSVMAWIHGGGFEVGNIYDQQSDGRYIAAQGDVIWVAIAYRLGPLGFLAGGGVEGNLGLHDQILGLKWVQKNIHAFGGDPHKVTVIGASAGSMSVGSLILSPLAKGLFHRAIMQSGAPTGEAMAQPLGKLEEKLHILGHNLQCKTSEQLTDTVACVRNKTVAELQKASFGDFLRNEMFVPLYGDNAVLPHKPSEVLKSGNFNHVDLLFGECRNEGTGFAGFLVPGLMTKAINVSAANQDILQLMKLYGRDDGQEIADFYLAGQENATQDELKILIGDVYGDLHLVCPTVLFSEQMVQSAHSFLFWSGNRFYSYRLMQENVNNPSNPKWMGIVHGQEGIYLFAVEENQKNAISSELSRDMIQTWTSFAKTGTPGKLGDVEWQEAYDIKAKQFATRIMHLEVGKYAMVNNHYVSTCDAFWRSKIMN